MLNKMRYLCFAEFAEADCVGEENGNDAGAEFGFLGERPRCQRPRFGTRRRASLQFRKIDNLWIVTEVLPILHNAGGAARTVARHSIPHCERNQLRVELTRDRKSVV